MHDVQVIQRIFNHNPCGYPLRLAVRLTGCKLTGNKSSEVEYTYQSREVRYYTSDAQDRRVVFCPSCGKKLPDVWN